MPNHVHLIAVPNSEDGLRRSIGEARRSYTQRVNFRNGGAGPLRQACFASFVLGDSPRSKEYSPGAPRFQQDFRVRFLAKTLVSMYNGCRMDTAHR